MKVARGSVLILALLCGVFGFAPDAVSGPHFVPNSQAFWDFSKNWTTEYGPAYRDTIEKVENLVPCTGRYALCFQSGPEPLPCEVTKDGRFANCTCTVEEGLNYVLITAILNYGVYRDTVAGCKPDSAIAPSRHGAGVQAIRDGKFIPGANVISPSAPTPSRPSVTSWAAGQSERSVPRASPAA
jgi:hypothetical protein